MATAGFKICGICEMRHKTNEATVWCPECEDTLCADCQEHHSISKASRTHKPIPIADFQKLPPFILDAKMFCEEHDEKYHHYCMSHERPLCKTCVVTAHKACKDLKTLDDVTNNCKSSYALEAAGKDLKEILCNIEYLKKDRQSNLSAIKEQRKNIIKKESELRDKINHHLDRIEKLFLADLSNATVTNEKRLADLIDSLGSKQSQIKELQESIGTIKQHASDFQTFLGMKEIETRVHEAKQYIQSIFDDRSLNQIEISCSIESNVENLTSIAEKMGTVTINEKPPQINLETTSDKQAQITRPVIRSNQDIQLQLVNQTTIVNGKDLCCILSSGLLIFTVLADTLKYQLSVHGQDGSFLYDINLGVYPCDVTQVGATDLVAVSSGYMRTILIVDISTKKRIVKKINIEKPVWGITYRDGCLIYCVKEQGLEMADVEHFKRKNIYKANIEFPAHIKAFCDKICITETMTTSVKVLNSGLQEIWQLSDRLSLSTPSHITADEKGYLYIANNGEPCSVTVISPDGQHIQSIQMNDFKSFGELVFDHTTKRLVVQSGDYKMLFFDIRR